MLLDNVVIILAPYISSIFWLPATNRVQAAAEEQLMHHKPHVIHRLYVGVLKAKRTAWGNEAVILEEIVSQAYCVLLDCYP